MDSACLPQPSQTSISFKSREVQINSWNWMTNSEKKKITSSAESPGTVSVLNGDTPFHIILLLMVLFVTLSGAGLSSYDSSTRCIIY